jgi:hypothetical protein
MSETVLDVPVILFVFNRPKLTERLLEIVRQARPNHLLVVSDGPRPGRLEDQDLCDAVRRLINDVDWACEVKTFFRKENAGCDVSIVEGLDWAFSFVDEAIILEDDCLPDSSFFAFCAELLVKYRDAPEVAMISGFSGIGEEVVSTASYYFGFIGSSWGWATWKDRWQKFDRNMKDWPIRRETGLRQFLRRSWDQKYYSARFDECYSHGASSPWDYRWFYSRLYFGGLAAIPRVNLVANIGFGDDATHTIHDEPYPLPARGHLEWPLTSPRVVARDEYLDELALNRLRYPFFRHVGLKLKQFFFGARAKRMDRQMNYHN